MQKGHVQIWGRHGEGSKHGRAACTETGMHRAVRDCDLHMAQEGTCTDRETHRFGGGGMLIKGLGCMEIAQRRSILKQEETCRVKGWCMGIGQGRHVHCPYYEANACRERKLSTMPIN